MTGDARVRAEGLVPDGGALVEWHDPMPREIPRQTYTPAVLALGLALFFWGFLTAWLLVGAGVVLILVGAGGWVAELVAQSTPTGGAGRDLEGDIEREHA